eukprot:CAMPEP_0197528832 /NCGR_PEP_ID=MMETSP1318-20131121/26479_1 /TAXON_ID=552666 /ORGANISM="Partenskyella glossopodia, Strain RCC365" /LENGTH=293 /DNA_ID=CAMNT_0043084089 /DNA_START=139 /DNA_END=1020 /DNA_ORIENTATION=-
MTDSSGNGHDRGQHGEQAEEYECHSGLKYLLYKPKSHTLDDNDNDEKKSWPLLIFLHGAGESGSGAASEIVSEGIIGCPPVELHYKRAVPELYQNFVVASPRTDIGWGRSDRIKEFALRLIFNETLRIDPKRVYLSGVSMGGAGVWVGAKTGVFAALAPVCAAGVARPKHINAPVWVFHGENDMVVPVGYSDRSVEIIKDSRKNIEIKYTRYKESPAPIGWDRYDGHASWMQVYSGEDPVVRGKTFKGHNGAELFKWMLSHSLPEEQVSAMQKFASKLFSPRPANSADDDCKR